MGDHYYTANSKQPTIIHCSESTHYSFSLEILFSLTKSSADSYCFQQKLNASSNQFKYSHLMPPTC